jgi:hypothetical protein
MTISKDLLSRHTLPLLELGGECVGECLVIYHAIYGRVALVVGSTNLCVVLRRDDSPRKGAARALAPL